MSYIKIQNLITDESMLKIFNVNSLVENSLNIVNLFEKENESWKLIKKAGTFFTKEEIKDFTSKGIFTLSVIDDPLSIELNELFINLFDSKTQREAKKNIDPILHKLVNGIFLNSSKSLYSFVSSCSKRFYKFDESVRTQLSSEIFYRAQLLAALNVYHSLVLGIYSEEYLTDIYNCTYLCDLELDLTLPLEKIRKRELIDLKDEELKELHLHPAKSFKKAQKYKAIFNDPDILVQIKVHHESVDGGGFPRKLNYKSLTIVNHIMTFSESIITYNDFVYGPEDTNFILMQGISEFSQVIDCDHILVNHWRNIFRCYFNSTNKAEQEDAA